MITTLHDPVVTEADGVHELEIEVTFAPGTLPPASVSYRVQPGELAVPDASVLPLVPAALVLACRASQDLRVAEPLPPAVHEGARAVASLLHDWYGWRPAELIAPLAAAPVRPRWAHRRRGLGVFFTRGIDSWGTLFDLLDGPKRSKPTHLITVDNEVHLDQAVRDAQVAETQAVADRLGLPLIVVSTDVRSLLDPHADWGTATHGSVLAGAGLLLRSTLRQVVIAPTHWTPLLRPWGSHPDLEPLWSTPDLRVTHHDGDEPRWKRVARVIEEPIAAQTVLVCWQGTGTRNCGRCEKCLRLMTSLFLLGMLDGCAGRFDVAFDPERITPDLVVDPHPWCDTMDHLDHVGLAADDLRQRWEQVTRFARPAMWFQTRAVQPRLPVVVAESVPDPTASVDAIARRLAVLGLRVDRRQPHRDDGTASAIVVVGHGDRVEVRTGAGAGVTVSPGDLDLDALRPLLDELGLDPDDAVPFDPDGQGPPPVVPEPPGWRVGADGATTEQR